MFKSCWRKLSEQFKAMTQGKCDYETEVIPVGSEEYGVMMCICSEEGVLYITREQAAKFFGFAH